MKPTHRGMDRTVDQRCRYWDRRVPRTALCRAHEVLRANRRRKAQPPPAGALLCPAGLAPVFEVGTVRRLDAVRITAMTRVPFLAVLLACSCGSDPSGTNGTCPDISGTWTVTQHCDATLVGASAVVTQTNCSLSFASPFNGFTGSVGADGTITLSGPQSCTGNRSGNSISLSCTPGTCAVTLTRAN